MKNNVRIIIIFFALISSVKMFGQSDISPAEAKEFFDQGKETVERIAKVWHSAKGEFWHDWYVIEYSDGYCIFNRFKRKRTIQDVINHSIGKGDCDWWHWPEGSPHVCLSSVNNAQYLVSRHGKIRFINMIDHPTKDCGD